MIVTREDGPREAKYLTTQAKTDPSNTCTTSRLQLPPHQSPAAMGWRRWSDSRGLHRSKARPRAYTPRPRGHSRHHHVASRAVGGGIDWMFTIRIDAEAWHTAARCESPRRGENPEPPALAAHAPEPGSPGLPVLPHRGGRTSLAGVHNLPCSVGLTEAQQTRVVASLRRLAGHS